MAVRRARRMAMATHLIDLVNGSAGAGSEKPIASNDTEDGRARNRRLELVVEKR